MLRPANTQGLTGLELVKHAGWPYHGKTTAEYYSGALSRRELAGHAWAAGAAPLEQLSHYPIRVSNPASPEWGYHFLYGLDGQLGSLGNGENPAAYSSTGRDMQLLGVPFKVNGNVLNIAIFHSSVGNLAIYDTKRGYSKNIPFAFSTSAQNRLAVYDASGRTRVVSLSELVGLGGAYPVLKTRVLDFYENKCLVSIEPTGFCESLASIPDDLDHRYYMSGAEPSQNHAFEQGKMPLCIVELTASGNDIDDVSALVKYSTAQCTGTVTRISPSSITSSGSSRSYKWSITVTDAIVDAWYNSFGGAQALRATFEHSRDEVAERASSNAYDLNYRVTCISKMTLGGVAQTYKHEFSWTLDAIPPANNLTVKIWLNDTLVSDQSGYQYNTVLWPIKDQHQRAPWPGSECRYLTQGFAVTLTGQGDFNPEIITTAYRNNGSSSNTLYGVRETFYRDAASSVVKKINVATVKSKAGTKNIAEFTDVVEWNDPRYARPEGANVFHMRGYVGAITRAIVNPMTGELSGGTVQRPIAYTGFR